MALAVALGSQYLLGMLLEWLLTDSHRIPAILGHFGRFDIFVTFPCHKCDICDTRPKVPTDTPNHHTYGPESIWNQFGTKNMKINPFGDSFSWPFQNIKFPGNGTFRGPRLPIFARHATGVTSDRFPSNPGHFRPFWPI